RKLTGRDPGRRQDDVRRPDFAPLRGAPIRVPEARRQLVGSLDRPRVGPDPVPAEGLRGVAGRDAEAYVRDPVAREVAVDERDADRLDPRPQVMWTFPPGTDHLDLLLTAVPIARAGSWRAFAPFSVRQRSGRTLRLEPARELRGRDLHDLAL